jgi:hypothetical protein
LSRALKDMDLVGKASAFPEPGEVVVTADKLSVEEKARILYRHARAGNLEETFRALIRQHASLIVLDKHFTPERIRRFIDERIPALAEETAMKPLSATQLKAEIVEAIRNPTKRMKKAFSKLSDTHRWILISLLECTSYPTFKELQATHNQHRPDISQLMLADALDDLVGTFVKYSNIGDKEYVDWIHPSYRDLVIDELTNDLKLQATFLRNASLPGLQLALSDAGGGTGGRALPFLGSDAAWKSLKSRALIVANEGTTGTVQALLILVTHSLRLETNKERTKELLRDILDGICDTVCIRWSTIPVKLDALKAYFLARSRLDSEPAVPNMAPSWELATRHLRKMLEENDLISETVVAEWTGLADLIKLHVPEYLKEPDIRANFRDDFEQLNGAIDRELDEYSPEDEELSQEADRMRSIAKSVSDFEYDDVVGGDGVTLIAARLETRAEDYEEQLEERGTEEYDPYDEPVEAGSVFSIETFFADL